MLRSKTSYRDLVRSFSNSSLVTIAWIVIMKIKTCITINPSSLDMLCEGKETNGGSVCPTLWKPVH